MMVTLAESMPLGEVLEQGPERPEALPAEAEFYSDYDWCLDPHLTVRDTIERLWGEIERLRIVPESWQIGEVATNVFLLSCALLNNIDEYLRGPTLRMPRYLAASRLGRGGRWAVEKTLGQAGRWKGTQVRRWRDSWQTDLDEFLATFASGTADRSALLATSTRLAERLSSPFPAGLLESAIGVPSAFGRLDVTHFDILALGRKFAERFPDRSQPILLLGVRTGGSYFAALLRAFFKAQGYRTVSSLTVQVNKGVGPWEGTALRRHAGRGFKALIVDDPPSTGSAVRLAIHIAYGAGFSFDNIAVLVPMDAARRDWLRSLPVRVVITLKPEESHKHQLLQPAAVEPRLTGYFERNGFSAVNVVRSRRADAFNAGLRSGVRGARLKRIYEVRLRRARGQTQTRYVLAKSVGWGWLSYHAFLAGCRLSDFVPPVLGLRDGILYTEWIPQRSIPSSEPSDRRCWIDASASYVAARVRALPLPAAKQHGNALRQHENGLRLLERGLSKAYRPFPADLLMWSRIRRRLSQASCPCPTLIDGKMRRPEWIVGRSGPLKTDFEHHGLGKAEINVKDPAYDLADIMLSLAPSPEEESRLIERYTRESGDDGVRDRLLVYKILAGFWEMECAKDHLFDQRQSIEEQQDSHRRFMSAWDFLTVHTARFCGTYCRSQQAPRWRPPLLALDVDGVLDRRIFGYPCTTAAGIEALSLLSAHAVSVALNTARSISEVKDYCEAYGLAGGVAEHGACAWDAVARREKVLISTEAARQLDELRRTLRRVPGVFLDERHKYSVRAFTYEDDPGSLLSRLVRSFRSFSLGRGAPAPVPTLVMNHVMTASKLDLLSFHHTMIDTTIVANEVNKGTGLVALRDWVLGADAETIAVGDSEADLPMFRVASRSFAPGQIGCAREARLLGCSIAPHSYQKGLLDIVRNLTGAEAEPGKSSPQGTGVGKPYERLFLELLRAADRLQISSLLLALFDSDNLWTFVR